jgi:hypothetical protein
VGADRVAERWVQHRANLSGVPVRPRECAFLAWLFTLCAPLNLTTWVDSLPEGEPPSVPYAVGSTLRLPAGAAVPLEGDDVEIVGVTHRGTMLFLEGEGHVWVEPDGTVADQPDEQWAGVQDAAVAPSGRWFASGRAIVDLRSGSVVAELPRDAAVITGWTRRGLVYTDRVGREFIKPVRAPGFRIRPYVWFPGRAPVGLTRWHGCWSVVRVNDDDDRSRWQRVCDTAGALTVSPDARWVVTRDLGVRTVRGRLHGHLAGAPLRVVGPPLAAYWTSKREVLIALPGAVVLCDVRDLACERALDREAVLPLR